MVYLLDSGSNCLDSVLGQGDAVSVFLGNPTKSHCMLLSTQVYKWVLVDFILRVTPMD